MVHAAFALVTLLVAVPASSECFDYNLVKQWGNGLWKSASVGNDNTILAVSTNNDLYQWRGDQGFTGSDQWQFIKAGIKQISVASKDNVFAIGWTDSVWKTWRDDSANTWKFDGFRGGVAFKQVSVSTTRDIWATALDGTVYYKDDAGALNIFPTESYNKKMGWVSTSPKKVYAVTAEWGNDFGTVYVRDPKSARPLLWDRNAARPLLRLKQIHYSENDDYDNYVHEKVFGTDVDDKIWGKWFSKSTSQNGQSWYQVCGSLTQVERGGDYLVGVNAAGNLYIGRVGSKFEIENADATAGDSGSHVIVIVVMVGCAVALFSCACVLFCVKNKKNGTAMTVEEDSDDDDDDDAKDKEEEEEEVDAVEMEMEMETMAVVTATDYVAGNKCSWQ